MSVKFKKSLSLLLAIVMIFGLSVCAFARTTRYPDTRPNNYRNSGKNRLDLVEVAKTQLGYTEIEGYDSEGNLVFTDINDNPGGYTKFGESFGNPNGEWCAYFVSWCASSAGIPTSVVPRLGNCANTVEWYKNHSEFRTASSGYIPKMGDIIFFNWSGGSTARHIGIVTGVSRDGKSVYTIEGNTGDGRGTQCLSRTRSRTANYIVGYGVPAYNDANANYGSYNFAGAAGNSQSGSVNYSTSLAIITTSATNITSKNATLHGAVANNGRLYISTAGFFFGEDKQKLTKYPVVSALSKQNFELEMDVASKFGELKTNTTYYYQTYACINGTNYLGPMYAVVTVNDVPQQLVLNEINIHVGIGQTSKITWTQLPYGSTDKGVTWVSDDEKIATISNDGLVKGIGYGSVRLRATTNYGSVNAECTATVLIPTPENVSAVNKSENNISVKWDGVSGSKGYVIYRNTDMDSEPQKYAEVDASATEFSDTGVEPGRKYYYRVMTVANDTSYNSDLSEAACATAKLMAPSEISAKQNGVWIDVTWNEVDGAKNYLVFRSTSENGLYSKIGKAYGCKYIDRTVLSGQTYYYKIVAENSDTRTMSNFSAIASAKSKTVNVTAYTSENSMLSSLPCVPVEETPVRIVRTRTKGFEPVF